MITAGERVPSGPAVPRSCRRKRASSQIPASETAIRTTVATRARRRLLVLRSTNGAIAISIAPKRLAPIAAQRLHGPNSPPESTETTAKPNVPTPIARNPPASRRSMPRPSTRNLIAVRIATIEATTATAVSRAMRAFGRS